jgi:hypothetical protein
MSSRVLELWRKSSLWAGERVEVALLVGGARWANQWVSGYHGEAYPVPVPRHADVDVMVWPAITLAARSRGT